MVTNRRLHSKHASVFFNPKSCIFGQCNLLATFQAFMNMIMIVTQDKHSLNGTEIIVYMDNILIATKEGATIEDHRAATWDILQVLQDHDLFLKPEKCVWESPHVDYLGLILEKGVTSMDPAKVNGIKSWPVPTMVKQVHSFLGFCNFYCALHLRILPFGKTPKWTYKERPPLDLRAASTGCIWHP